MLTDSLLKFKGTKVLKFENAIDDDTLQDPTKIIFKMEGISGHDLANQLHSFNIDVDKSTETAIIISCHSCISKENILDFIAAFEKIHRKLALKKDKYTIPADLPLYY